MIVSRVFLLPCGLFSTHVQITTHAIQEYKKKIQSVKGLKAIKLNENLH